MILFSELPVGNIESGVVVCRTPSDCPGNLDAQFISILISISVIYILIDHGVLRTSLGQTGL